MSNNREKTMRRHSAVWPGGLSTQTLHAVDTWKIALPSWRTYGQIILSGELRMKSPAFLQFDDGLSACISFSSKDTRGFVPFVERIPLGKGRQVRQGRLLLYIRMHCFENSILGTMETQIVHAGLPEEAVAFESLMFSVRESGFAYLTLQSEREAGILPGSRLTLWGQG